jgi:hypothetical protein
MQPDKTEQLNSIVAALTDYITVVRSFQLQETAVLLDMAKLDLQMKIHSISDRELQALCEALERQGAVTRGKRKSRALSNVTASSGAGRRQSVALPPAPTTNDIIVPRRRPRLRPGRTLKRVRNVS